MSESWEDQADDGQGGGGGQQQYNTFQPGAASFVPSQGAQSFVPGGGGGYGGPPQGGYGGQQGGYGGQQGGYGGQQQGGYGGQQGGYGGQQGGYGGQQQGGYGGQQGGYGGQQQQGGYGGQQGGYGGQQQQQGGYQPQWQPGAQPQAAPPKQLQKPPAKAKAAKAPAAVSKPSAPKATEAAAKKAAAPAKKEAAAAAPAAKKDGGASKDGGDSSSGAGGGGGAKKDASKGAKTATAVKAAADAAAEKAAADAEAFAPKDAREHVNIIFIGHVDAGKSTIGGHLMFLTGGVDKRTLEKYEREAKEANRESWYLSWALDTSEEERAKGKTVECGRAFFATEKKHYTIIDAPGHKSYVPSMIGGAVQADVAVLVISARKGEFEAGFDRGGQTREHAMLAKAAGVKTLIVVVNKMDLLEWAPERYEEVKSKLSPFLKKTGFKPADVQFMPISGQSGEGLIKPVDPTKCGWYEGPAFVPFLDALPKNSRDLDKPFRMAVADMYTDMGCWVIGKVTAGIVKKGQKLTMMPLERTVVVQDILNDDEEAEVAVSGDNVKLKCKNIEETEVHAGYVLCMEGSPCSVGHIFDAQVMIMDYKSIICPGFQCILHLNTTIEEVKFKGLICYVDKKTGKPDKKKGRPRFVREGEIAIVRIETTQGICMELFKSMQSMARFTLRDEGKTIGRGNVLKIVQARPITAAANANAAAASAE